MKDYTFAEKLYQLRKSEGISQKELSKSLDVTNKAISKWETGEAFPSVSQLIKLSELFNTSIDDLLKPTTNNSKNITKICITGGPCSGKSTALSWIQTEFRKKGYHVLFVPETATELILGGIAPWTIDTNMNFETYIIKLQIEKEKLFEEAAKHIYGNDKILIV
ncbi:MAG: helix-turn-helix domain-containing protein, partial [Clostridia bacterium]|nr:helix-turn-helix domain-containing protein [Clostridia bacterium]